MGPFHFALARPFHCRSLTFSLPSLDLSLHPVAKTVSLLAALQVKWAIAGRSCERSRCPFCVFPWRFTAFQWRFTAFRCLRTATSSVHYNSCSFLCLPLLLCLSAASPPAPPLSSSLLLVVSVQQLFISLPFAAFPRCNELIFAHFCAVFLCQPLTKCCRDRRRLVAVAAAAVRRWALETHRGQRSRQEAVHSTLSTQQGWVAEASLPVRVLISHARNGGIGCI